MNLPQEVLYCIQALEAAGFQGYAVGGCVRDTLMGLPPHDWDVAVTTAPHDTMAICHAAGYRTIPTGLKHGTVTVILPHSGIPADRESSYDLIECTTCRTEGSYTDGRHPDAVAFTGRIEDDLSRRDFTVNAMALTMDAADSAQEGDSLTVLDLFGGQNDLKNGIIRAVGNPDTRFSEDALRLMRGVRFGVKLGFAIEENTYAAMIRNADGLARISRERISEEFQKILTSPEPERGVELLLQTGMMPHVLPHGISPKGTGDLSSLPAEFGVRMASLMWGMEEAAIADNLAGLRLPNGVRKDILAITRAMVLTAEPTAKCARAWRHVLGNLAIPALSVLRAHSHADSVTAIDKLSELVRISAHRNEPVSIGELAIGGNDLIALGFAPGRSIKETLDALLKIVLEDPEKNTRDMLIKEALSRKD